MGRVGRGLCTMMAMLLCAAVPAFAQEEMETYAIEEIYMEIGLPSDMVVITPEAAYQTEALVEEGLDVAAVQEYLAWGGIDLNAISPDFETEVMIYHDADEGMQDIWNLGRLTDDEIIGMARTVNERAENRDLDMGYLMDSVYVYRRDSIAFLVIDAAGLVDGAYIQIRQCATIYNGCFISLVLRGNRMPLTTEQQKLFQDIVDSIHFTATLPKHLSGGKSDRAIGNALWEAFRNMGIGLLVMGVGAAVGILIMKRRDPRNLAGAVVMTKDFDGEKFFYNGKNYNKELYLAMRVAHYQKKGGTLLELGNALAKMEHSDKLLDGLDVEAIRLVIRQRQESGDTKPADL
ncbi:hypothetical protein LJC20_01075 [Eubacteriales bacterium OttesenSCG-928-M02]|nr:hypothetical protein [Eubacteriales bacterium OttesenSCG-928-M02]